MEPILAFLLWMLLCLSLSCPNFALWILLSCCFYVQFQTMLAPMLWDLVSRLEKWVDEKQK